MFSLHPQRGCYFSGKITPSLTPKRAIPKFRIYEADLETETKQQQYTIWKPKLNNNRSTIKVNQSKSKFLTDLQSYANKSEKKKQQLQRGKPFLMLLPSSSTALLPSTALQTVSIPSVPALLPSSSPVPALLPSSSTAFFFPSSS
ncbi:hypothetical protein RIF29_29252 [Crotalaria pallida]|uniref:Uncharacterized protein n=1 Tax=Crotalaria pallida TaxID=3830 RepID=A0AAN9EF55_CROPI